MIGKYTFPIFIESAPGNAHALTCGGIASLGFVCDQLLDFQHFAENLRQNSGIYHNVSCPFVHDCLWPCIRIAESSSFSWSLRACFARTEINDSVTFSRTAVIRKRCLVPAMKYVTASTRPCRKNNCIHCSYSNIPWNPPFVKGFIWFFEILCLKKCFRRTLRPNFGRGNCFLWKRHFFSFFW